MFFDDGCLFALSLQYMIFLMQYDLNVIYNSLAMKMVSFLEFTQTGFRCKKTVSLSLLINSPIWKGANNMAVQLKIALCHSGLD